MLIHYYHKFLPNLLTWLHPLNDLLKAGNIFKWLKECTDEFTTQKAAFVLDYFDVSLIIKLARDACVQLLK